MCVSRLKRLRFSEIPGEGGVWGSLSFSTPRGGGSGFNKAGEMDAIIKASWS